MKKTKKIIIVMLTGILSFGLMNNAIYAAAAKTADQALLDAAKNGNVDEVRMLLDAKIDINTTDQNGSTAIIIATNNGHNNVIAQLIEAGTNINKATQNGWTALMSAALKGHNDVVAQLIQAGADINAANKDGITALMIAAQNGHNNVVAQLIQAGADINAANKDGMTALTIAACRGHNDVVVQLIQAGADINAANKDGMTALTIATLKGHKDVVAQLIQAGANINTADQIGMTALMVAAHNNHNNVAQQLMHGLLVEQMRNAREQVECLGTYNGTCGSIGVSCGMLTQLPSDLLNRILWYAGAQEFSALHRTCRGMSQIQPDAMGFSAMLRQATSKNFLQNCAPCGTNIKPGAVAHLWQYLMEFLQEEDKAPMCNADKWTTSIQNKIKCGKIDGSLSDEQVRALESLIDVVGQYYQTSIKMILPSATAQQPVAVASEGAQAAPMTCAALPQVAQESLPSRAEAAKQNLNQ